MKTKQYSVILLMLSTMLMAGFVNADTIYRELFTAQAGGVDDTLEKHGWLDYIGVSAAQGAAKVSGAAGTAWDDGPVNSSPFNSTKSGAGYIYGYINSYLDTLIITEEFSFNMSAWTNLQFSMRTNFEKATDVRAAIKVDGTWYVSDGVAVPALAGWAGAKLWKVDADGIAWHPLDLTAGSTLVVGASSVTLPSIGTVQGFGFYSEALLIADWNRVRADVFTISGSPANRD